MIFADKVIRLRKKNGWSQEELAEKMNVSRQAVSKWEGAQTIPDLQKILQLAALFGVTTDYLLKDEIENEEFTDTDEEPNCRRVTLSEANQYLQLRKAAARKIALATFLCIISPIPLLLLGGATVLGVSENLAGGIGLIALLLIVAAAVALFVLCGFKNSPYEFLDQEPFTTEYGVKGMVKEQQKAYRPAYAVSNTIATAICVLAPIPLLIGSFLKDEFTMVVLLCVTILFAAVGVAIFILAGVPWAGMQRLLKDGEFSPAEKKKNKITGTVSTIYWMTTVAIYLVLSFITGNWKTSWIVWPVAGLLYAAVIAVCNLLIAKRDGR